MLLYSVWDPAGGMFRYFSSEKDAMGSNVPAPKHLRHTAMGLPPEAAAWPLPREAKYVGRGSMAKGRVAALAGDDNTETSTSRSRVSSVLLLAAGGLVLWWGLRE